MRNWLVPKWIT